MISCFLVLKLLGCGLAGEVEIIQIIHTNKALVAFWQEFHFKNNKVNDSEKPLQSRKFKDWAASECLGMGEGPMVAPAMVVV